LRLFKVVELRGRRVTRLAAQTYERDCSIILFELSLAVSYPNVITPTLRGQVLVMKHKVEKIFGIFFFFFT
jgi:uncharacterized membrane protein